MGGENCRLSLEVTNRAKIRCDISKAPFQEKDVAEANPEVVKELGAAFDQWWESTLPLMVNEDLPRLKEEEFPFNLRYHKQLKERGIPDWAPASIE